VNAAARIFLHIRSLRRGVCVLNCCNNSLFMVRQSVFGHEGLPHLTCNMSWCMMHYTCGEEGVYFGGSWVASCFSPLLRRGRGAEYNLRIFLLIALCLLVVISTACWLKVPVCQVAQTVTRKSEKPLPTSVPPLCSLCLPTDLSWTDGPFGPQRYHLHLLLQ
jgi:hypothetical protein